MFSISHECIYFHSRKSHAKIPRMKFPQDVYRCGGGGGGGIQFIEFV